MILNIRIQSHQGHGQRKSLVGFPSAKQGKGGFAEYIFGGPSNVATLRQKPRFELGRTQDLKTFQKLPAEPPQSHGVLPTTACDQPNVNNNILRKN
jgi:hypothetical protein